MLFRSLSIPSSAALFPLSRDRFLREKPLLHRQFYSLLFSTLLLFQQFLIEEFFHFLNSFFRRGLRIVPILPPVDAQLGHQAQFAERKRNSTRGIRHEIPGPVANIINLALLPRTLHGLIEGSSHTDRKSTRLNSSHMPKSRMPSSA